MAAGVTMIAPDTVHLAWDTQIAGGAVIEPYVVFAPGATVEAGAVIRAFSHLEGAVVRAGAIVGPYARLRPAPTSARAPTSAISSRSRRSRWGGGQGQPPQLSGRRRGRGGRQHRRRHDLLQLRRLRQVRDPDRRGRLHRLQQPLVAPVKVGAGAFTGSGSVITEDVAPDALALGRGAQTVKPGWAKAFRALKAAARRAKP
jgi:bifunctional UDP-N-acetylglucosamine pyrophosphorylase/glucosamine-1-phosphate N-acetyltransferase